MLVSRRVALLNGGAFSRFVNDDHLQKNKMEDDRAQVDLGIAVDVEERLEEEAAQRQPKKRFVGRRQADAAAKAPDGAHQEAGAIQGMPTKLS